jgi:hypothetical protein
VCVFILKTMFVWHVFCGTKEIKLFKNIQK